jgi:murein DD-endopeptidase MepM/ murein hydrolase activator NlpD
MRRVPLTPFLIAIAAMSSTGHGTPMAPGPAIVDLTKIPDQVKAGLERDFVEPASRLEQGLRGAIGRFGDKIANTLDTMRAAAKLDTPDLTALRVEPVANAATSGFGWREDPINKRRKWHSGADIRGKHGTPVAVAGDGKVILAEYKGVTAT